MFNHAIRQLRRMQLESFTSQDCYWMDHLNTDAPDLEADRASEALGDELRLELDKRKARHN